MEKFLLVMGVILLANFILAYIVGGWEFVLFNVGIFVVCAVAGYLMAKVLLWLTR